jgi:hypothetical protein
VPGVPSRGRRSRGKGRTLSAPRTSGTKARTRGFHAAAVAPPERAPVLPRLPKKVSEALTELLEGMYDALDAAGAERSLSHVRRAAHVRRVIRESLHEAQDPRPRRPARRRA